jgi:glycosyltransferase involved in cell wall biosynthesis
MNVILSVVVPTKNRISYLKCIIDYFASINDSDVELIVQDNSDQTTANKLQEYLRKIQDQRIIYKYSDEPLSQKENCDLAIHQAKGFYVLMLGDDDIFSKYLIEHCRVWKERKIDAVLSKKASYIWPDVTPRLYKSKLSSVFQLPRYTSKETYLDIDALKRKFINTGGVEIGDMPRVYHGVATKDSLNKIYKITGSYCPGPSPDIANAISLLYTVNSFLYVDIPLVVSGQCVKSAGGKGSQGEHYGEIESVRQLPINQSSKWFEHIPFYWSGKTIYAQSSIEALTSLDLRHVADKLNREYLLASCLVFDSRYLDRIIKCMKLNGLAKFHRIIFYYFLIWFNRLSVHIVRAFKSKNNFSKKQKVKNTREVIDIIDKNIQL